MAHPGIPHQYGRAFLRANKVVPIWKCFDPNCHHYYFDFELVVGKNSRCWRCKKTFVLKRLHKTVKKPHCNCNKRDKEIAETVDPIDNVMKSLGFNMEEKE